MFHVFRGKIQVKSQVFRGENLSHVSGLQMRVKSLEAIRLMSGLEFCLRFLEVKVQVMSQLFRGQVQGVSQCFKDTKFRFMSQVFIGEDQSHVSGHWRASSSEVSSL